MSCGEQDDRDQEDEGAQDTLDEIMREASSCDLALFDTFDGDLDSGLSAVVFVFASFYIGFLWRQEKVSRARERKQKLFEYLGLMGK